MRPGEYVPDSTEGITRVEDLPQPLLLRRSPDYRRRPCPRCGRSCFRHGRGRRFLHDLGCLLRDRPRRLLVIYSQHYCTRCRSYFNADMASLAAPGSHYTQRVIRLAGRLVVADGLPYRCASWHLWRDHRVFVPFATLQNRVEAAGEKAQAEAESAYLDWTLTDFSGYLAADELYDGPFCLLSAVDARHQRRLLHEVLDRSPNGADILCFLARLNDQIVARGHTVVAITTDASPLYPQPIAVLFGGIPHQVCEFHIKKELTKAVLRVLARLRKQLAAEAPQLPRGRCRNTPKAHRLHKQARAIEQQVRDLFDHRHLFVRHHLTAARRLTLLRLVRGQPLLRSIRAIMDEVYRLFDRRCRAETALAKLALLRRRVRRYPSLGRSLDKLHSPNLEKALTFLDDKLLPATSNAVERGNRRLRKMQKTIYRVRKQETLEGRLALDLQRDQQAGDRQETLASLHNARN